MLVVRADLPLATAKGVHELPSPLGQRTGLLAGAKLCTDKRMGTLVVLKLLILHAPRNHHHSPRMRPLLGPAIFLQG